MDSIEDHQNSDMFISVNTTMTVKGDKSIHNPDHRHADAMTLDKSVCEGMEVVEMDHSIEFTYLEDFDFFNCSAFKRVKILGSGTTGNVHLVQSTASADQFAAKMFLFDSLDQDENAAMFNCFRQETSILRNLKHDNIMKLVQPIAGPSHGVLFLELCHAGPMCKHLLTLTEAMVWKYFTQILNAVGYMHSQRFIHRDIKLANILVKGDKAVLTDFGLSQKVPKGNNIVHGHVGTPTYMAPEIMAAEMKPFLGYDGLKADSFALGVYLWCLLRKCQPYLFVNCLSVLEKEANVFGIAYDEDLLDCARKLLVSNPADRFTVTELQDSLDKRMSLD